MEKDNNRAPTKGHWLLGSVIIFFVLIFFGAASNPDGWMSDSVGLTISVFYAGIIIAILSLCTAAFSYLVGFLSGRKTTTQLKKIVSIIIVFVGFWMMLSIKEAPADEFTG